MTKRLTAACAAVVLSVCTYTSTFADRVPDPVRLRAGTWEQRDKSLVAGEVEDALRSLASRDDQRRFVVQFRRPLDRVEREALAEAGLELQTYVNNFAYITKLDTKRARVGAIAQLDVIHDIQPLQTAWKVDPPLRDAELPGHILATPEFGEPIVAVYVQFHPDVALDSDAVDIAIRHGAIIRSVVRSIDTLVLEMPLSGLDGLAAEDDVLWIETPLPPLTENNNSNRNITQANLVQEAPYLLDGSGVRVLVFDAGTVYAGHPDFAGRITSGQPGGYASHPTHVAGTVGGSGASSGGTYRGMAPGVHIISYAFEWSDEGYFLYSDPGDIEQDYDDAINIHDADLSNNSIGTNTCWNGFPCVITGDYGLTSRLIDSIVIGSLGRDFRVVWSNGNERNCNRCRLEGEHTEEGYHSTAPPACAKNHITVGALNSNNDSMTGFSSWGPTDDGRLKPDLCGPGCQSGGDGGVTSSNNGGGYTTMCGTSMSSPTVAGLCSLILQDFRIRFPELPDPRNSTLKVLLAQEAADLGNPGPDYQYGYGSVRVKDSIDLMRTGSFVEQPVDQGETLVIPIWVEPGDDEVKVTAAWDDTPGSPVGFFALINDLDLRVIDPYGNTYLPWTLTPSDPGAPAVQTNEDHLNNIEQVYVPNPQPGVWYAEVYGYNVISTDPQIVSVAVSPWISQDCDDNGIPDEQQINDDPALDCDEDRHLDVCQPDCDGDGIADVCELLGGDVRDCNNNLIPDECEPWEDCNNNGVYDDCDIADGTVDDCNNNWIPDVCIELEDDCNGNLIPDTCDIAEGTVADCDANGVPDSCEWADCNENGIFDPCDILEGLSNDCNDNSIPDECEPPSYVYVDDNSANDPGPGDPGISDPNEDGSFEHPFDSIQEAINAASCPEIILLRDGIYTGEGNGSLNFGGQDFELMSENGPENCIIDGGGVQPLLIFESGESPYTLVEGLTLRNGHGPFAGAIQCINGSQPVVRNCIIENCTSTGGGGIDCRYEGNATFENCIIRNCQGTHAGGVLVNVASPTLRNCVIINNQSSGVYVQGGSITIENCVIAGNVEPGSGGGICALSDTHIDVMNTMIVNNSTEGSGGGIFNVNRSSADLRFCTIAGNTAGSRGGGFYGAGVSASMENCLVAANTAENGNEVGLSGASLSVTYSNIVGGQAAMYLNDGSVDWGAGNMDIDPVFASPQTGDYHLGIDSPCIDAGDPNFNPGPEQTDVDGHDRVIGDRVDIGADEAIAVVVGDANCDGVVDNFDIDAFVMRLTDVEAYRLAYPGCIDARTDISGDGAVNNFDIDPFVELLTD